MIKNLIIFVSFIFTLLSTSGQSKYYDYNKSQIELIKKRFDTVCKDYNSEKPVSKKMIEWDKKIILFLNEVYNTDLTLTQIQASYKKILHKELTFRFDQVTDLGGFKNYETSIYSEGNLKAEIHLVIIDDLILYKKIRLETKRYTSCFNPSIFGISFYDVKYLEEQCLKSIDFPISVETNGQSLSTDKTYFEKLNPLKAKGHYSFTIDTTKQLDDLIYFQTINYSFQNPSLIVRDLYKNIQVDSLGKLLYAPNHIVAINAMEALLALNKIKNVSLTNGVLNKMNEIKNSNLKISWTSGDVGYHAFKTYKELNLSENEVLEKYKKIQ